MYRYAQLDENNIVVGDSMLSGEVTADNMIPISDDMASPIGKLYQNGEFIDNPNPPEPSIDYNQLQETTALNVEYLVTLAELGGSNA